MLARYDGTIGDMLSRAIKKVAQDNLPSNADILGNISACKTDVMQTEDCAAEARRLFTNTTSYDSDIAAVKRAIQEGSPVVNVVCRGYTHEPQKSLVNLIIKSALVDPPTLGPDDEDYELDRRQRLERLQNTIIGRRFFRFPSGKAELNEIQSDLESQLLGETRWDPDSSFNAVLAYLTRDEANEFTLPTSEVPLGSVNEGQLSQLLLDRKDDLICDPDVKDSYLYPFLSETGTKLGSLEIEAKRRRTQLRNSLSSDSPSQALSKNFESQDRSRLNIAAQEMNRFYHSLFNLQGFENEENYRFIPFRMDDPEIFSVKHWNERGSALGVEDFVDVSKGLPSLSEIGKARNIQLDPHFKEEEVGGEIPKIRKYFNFSKTFEPLVKALWKDVDRDSVNGIPTANEIIQAVPNKLFPQRDNSNVISAIAALLSKDVRDWFMDRRPKRAEVASYLGDLIESVRTLKATDMPDRDERDVLENAVNEQKSDKLDLNFDPSDSLQKFFINLPPEQMYLPDNQLRAKYPMEQISGSERYKIKEEPTNGEIHEHYNAEDQLVYFWVEYVPKYVLDNLTPENVWSYMIFAAPRFAEERIALGPEGEDIPVIDQPLLVRVYDLLREISDGRRNAIFIADMRKLAAYQPRNIPGYEELSERLVGTEGKRISEVIRGRAKSWALLSALKQVVNTFQGQQPKPDTKNAVSARPPKGEGTEGITGFSIDFDDVVGGAIPNISRSDTDEDIQKAILNARLTLVSEDGKVFERAKPATAFTNRDKKSVAITIDEPINEELGTPFRVLFNAGSEKATPSNDELSSFEYGGPINAKKARNLQDKYGVSVNRSPLPNWSPNPYCFVWSMGEMTPNPNNVYNVVDGLRKREKVLSYHRQKENEQGPEYALHREAVKKLSREVEEMRALLNWAKRAMQSEIIWSPEQGATSTDPVSEGRYNANALTRYVSDERDGQPTARSFYEIVRSRCQDRGINIPVYDVTLDDETIERVLPPNQFAEFLEVKASVMNDFQNDGRSILVLDHVDNNVSKGHSNGIVEYIDAPPSNIEREGDAPLRDSGGTQSLQFAPRIATMIDNFSNFVHENRRAHVVAISTEPIVGKGSEKTTNVTLSVDIASPEVITEYIRMAEANLKRTLPSKESQGFALPESFVAKMRKGLSGLMVSDVKPMVGKMIGDLFEQYQKVGDIGLVLVNNEEDIRERLSKMQSKSEVRTRLNIERKTPKVGYKEYVTEAGSKWNQFIQGKFARMAETIRENKRTIDLLSRCQDFNVFFGNMEYKETEEGVILNPTYSESGKLVWFSPDGDPNVKSNTSLKAAADRFGLSPIPMNDYLESVGSSGVERVGFDPNALSSYLESFRGKINAMETSIESAKKSIKPVNVLYGGPGTGKTIFGDVLAKAFDLHLDFCTFTKMFHAGGTSLRGQAEANVRDFLNYCRSARDTVMVIDEFDKFFLGSAAGGDAGDVNRLQEQLQVAWENDQPTYKAHNFYIICTTNQTMESMKSNPRFEALVNRMGRFEVKLPKGIESMLEFFGRGAAVNNLINLTCGDDDRLIEWGKRLVEIWDVPGEEKQKQALIDSINKINPKFFEHYGILRPELDKSKYLKKIGVDYNEVIDPVKDWVEGWKMSQTLFTRMSQEMTTHQTSEGPVEISWLDRICRLMQDKMIYPPDPNAPDPGENIVTRMSLREMMTKVQEWIEMHGSWARGESGNLPLTSYTMWYGLAGSTFGENPLTEEELNLPHYRYLQEEPSMLESEDGFEVLKNAVTTPGSGVKVEDFMDQYSVEYQVNARVVESAKDPSIAISTRNRLPQMAEKIFEVAKKALHLEGTGSNVFQEKGEKYIRALEKNNVARSKNAAVMIQRFLEKREAVALNIMSYENIKETIIEREESATEQEKKQIGELLVPIRSLADNGSASGLDALLRTSVFDAMNNLPDERLDYVKNWFNLIADGYQRIAGVSSSCRIMAQELGSSYEASKIVEKKMAMIDNSREKHFAESSIRLSDLSPNDLTPEELEQYKSALGLGFKIPEDNYDETLHEIIDDIQNEGVIEDPDLMEEEMEEDPDSIMEEEMEEDSDSIMEEDPDLMEEEPESQDQPPLTTSPGPSIHLTPDFTRTDQEQVEEPQAEQTEETVVEDIPGSMTERIEKRKKKKNDQGNDEDEDEDDQNKNSSYAAGLIKTAQSIDDDTARRVAGWSNLKTIGLLAKNQPVMKQIGIINYIDGSDGLQGFMPRRR